MGFIFIKSGLILPREIIFIALCTQEDEMPFIYQKVFPQDSLISVTSAIIILLFERYTIKETEPHFPRMSNCLIKMLVKNHSLFPHFPSLLSTLFFAGRGLVSEILIECVQSMNT